jgi:hypothetical protein
MSKKPKTPADEDPFEDYMLGHIARLEAIIRDYAAGDRTKLQLTRAALAEARRTLKKYRELAKGRRA